jgi:lipoprotein-anchoring transpeptidase ErfK/SrfK
MIRSSFAILAIGLAASPLSAHAQALYANPDVTGSIAPRIIQGIGPQADTPLSSAQPGRVQTASSSLGGGFIELLMTGRDPSNAARGGVIYNDPGAGIVQRPARAMRAAPSHSSLDRTLPDQDADEAVQPRRRARTAALGTAEPDMRPIARALPAMYQKQIVDYSGKHAPGTIVIDTPNKFLFLVQPGGKAMRYGIGVGRPGFEWAGVKSVTMKKEWPDWRPPAQMLKRRPDLPRFMPGGADNPLGARAMYLGSSLYRIHGTNEPHTIGQAVSSGCIRMTNDDVTDLYTRVRVGSKVIVM